MHFSGLVPAEDNAFSSC